MVKNSQKLDQDGFFRRNLLTIFLSVSFVIMVIMSLPSVMVILFALLPTFVAFIVDKTPEKNAVFCVGSLNICGVLPYLVDMWTGNNSMDAAILILTDVFSLVVMYGASAFGWMIFQSLPPIIATFITVLAQSRISSLRSAQLKLVEEWGDIVVKPDGVDDIQSNFISESAKEPLTQTELPPLEKGKILDGHDDAISNNEISLNPESGQT